jgi:hypothetical protein
MSGSDSFRFSGLLRSWLNFWFLPADPIGLHCLRVLAGLLFLSWLLPFAGHLDPLFGLEGWLDQQARYAALELPGGPPPTLGWSILDLCGGDSTSLTVVYWLSLAVLILFTLGLWTRLTGVLTWLIVVSFTANPAISFDADALLVILAFYLMIGYLLLGLRAPNQSLGARLLGSRATWLFGSSSDRAAKSIGANVALRLLQVHIALILFTSGLHKLQFGDWWVGVALWYPLHPPFETSLASARAWAPFGIFYMTLLSLVSYAVLAWQIGFPFFAWKRRWRPVLIVGAVLGWVGSSLVYRLPLFGPVFFIGCLSYLSGVEWHALIRLLVRLPQRLGLARLLPSKSERALRASQAEKEVSRSVVASRAK